MTPIITHTCQSPLGMITMASDGTSLLGLWIEGQNHFLAKHHAMLRSSSVADCAVFVRTREWLDTYFSGQEPSFTPPIRFIGSIFQKQVWEILLGIPYGKVITYNEIAGRIARSQGKHSMSAQAVGGAVGHNPVSIIVPCHRVVGSGGSLTGYAGGVDRKIRLLELERTDMSKLTWKQPRKTASEVLIQEATIKDCDKMLDVQHHAFLPVSLRLDWMDAPNLTETPDMAEKAFADYLNLKMTDEKGNIIGIIRGDLQDGSLHISRLMILPDYQGKGYGTLLLRAIQARMPHHRAWLNTCEQLPGNVHLYQREGFRPFRREKINDHLSRVYMEKGTEEDA